MRNGLAVVAAQLVEWLLPTPEVHCSNPVISKHLYLTFICLLSTVFKRRKKEKRGCEWPIFRRGFGTLGTPYTEHWQKKIKKRSILEGGLRDS